MGLRFLARWPEKQKKTETSCFNDTIHFACIWNTFFNDSACASAGHRVCQRAAVAYIQCARGSRENRIKAAHGYASDPRQSSDSWVYRERAHRPGNHP